MDDFVISNLHESKNEWGARLLIILTPLIVEGLRSIFDESFALCKKNNEMDKYLMTFQNFIARIPKWNTNIIENEKQRIIERSGCTYLEEILTCVHIIQLKILTAIRVGQKQKKIDITIPKLSDFIHNVYIHVARKVYKNVYLFELGIPPLEIQKNQHELEKIIQECILNTIRESIPIETILSAYLDETTEEDVTEEIKEEVVDSTPIPPDIPDSLQQNNSIVNGGNSNGGNGGNDIPLVSPIPVPFSQPQSISTSSSEFIPTRPISPFLEEVPFPSPDDALIDFEPMPEFPELKKENDLMLDDVQELE